MKTFNFILTKILRVGLIFWLVFIWARFYIDNLAWVIVLTSAITLLFEFAISAMLRKNTIKANLANKEIAQADGFANFFVFNPKSVAVNFFYNTFNKHYPTTKRADYISFENNGKKTILFPLFRLDKLNLNDIVTIFNKVKNLPLDNLIICTNLFDTNISGFIKNLPLKITILDKYAIYEQIFKRFDNFPAECYEVKQRKNSFRSLIEYSLNRKKTKGYIFASIILLISTLFVKMTVYYLIISSILLLLAIFSYSNSIFNKKVTAEDLF